MEETNCELGETFQDGDVTCMDELELCLRCSGGIWEPVDSESTQSSVQD
jgi:hypothetical protein